MWQFILRGARSEKELCRPPLFKGPETLALDGAKRVLVFAPHPDDETLGCGGTLKRLAEHARVKVVLVTDGSGAGELPSGTAEIRQNEFLSALAVLKVKEHSLWRFPDGQLQNDRSLQLKIKEELILFRPNWIFSPSPLDYHRDHRDLSQAVWWVASRLPDLDLMLFYETWAPSFASHIVDITETAEAKWEALAEHRTALQYGDYARAARGLAEYRGLYLGRDRLAEAFWVLPPRESEAEFQGVLKHSMRWASQR